MSVLRVASEPKRIYEWHARVFVNSNGTSDGWKNLSCKANARVKPAKTGTARTLPNFCVVLYIFVLFCVFLCCSMYCLFCVVLCIVCVYMCTVLLPPGGYSIAVKYIISYQICAKNRGLRMQWVSLTNGVWIWLCSYNKFAVHKGGTFCAT
jgi:hypothetical protein